MLGASTLPFLWNIIRSYRYGEVTTADDPWGYGNSLEWATSSPPPRHNFLSLPRIRSERPAFELLHPYMIDRMRSEAHSARGWKPLAEAEASAHLKVPGSSPERAAVVAGIVVPGGWDARGMPTAMWW